MLPTVENINSFTASSTVACVFCDILTATIALCENPAVATNKHTIVIEMIRIKPPLLV